MFLVKGVIGLKDVGAVMFLALPPIPGLRTFPVMTGQFTVLSLLVLSLLLEVGSAISCNPIRTFCHCHRPRRMLPPRPIPSANLEPAFPGPDGLYPWRILSSVGAEGARPSPPADAGAVMVLCALSVPKGGARAAAQAPFSTMAVG